MPTAYVYSPLTGKIRGRENYCCDPCNPTPCTGACDAHGTCNNWSSPVDVSGTGDIYLYVNYSTVRSIRTVIDYKCCSSGAGDDYRRIVKVDLYGDVNAICHIGSLLYGHVSNVAVGNNQVYNLTSGSKLIGTVPGGTSGTCYQGGHSHMERLGGSTIAPCCCADAYAGTTAIYRWDFPACPVK